MTKETKNKIQYGKVIAKQVEYDHIDLSKMDTVYTKGTAYFRITKDSAFNSIVALTKMRLDELDKSLNGDDSNVSNMIAIQSAVQAFREFIASVYLAEDSDNGLIQNLETSKKVIQQQFTFEMAMDMALSMDGTKTSIDDVFPKFYSFVKSLVGVGFQELSEDLGSYVGAKLPKVKE